MLSCTHPTYTSCSVTHEIFDSAYLTPLGGGNGEGIIKVGKAGKTPTIRINCTSAGTPFQCKYSAEELGLEFTGGVPASLEVIGSMPRLEGSAAFCPATVMVQATSFKTRTGVALYMAEA